MKEEEEIAWLASLTAEKRERLKAVESRSRAADGGDIVVHDTDTVPPRIQDDRRG